MAKYKSTKQTKPENKKQAGSYKTVNLASSDFLPNVFQTRLNQKWLDATFDQLVSKGGLEDIDSYIGDSSGRHSVSTDTYLNTGNTNSQLKPGIVSSERITYDDVAQALEQYFDDYNYNAAYQTESYAYNPPIDKDKFLNYSSYYWIPNLPVYESDNRNSTGTYTVDPLTDINGKVTHTFVDDNNSFELEDGMRIKFELGYGASISQKIYIVTGVGKEINLRLYTDVRDDNNYPIWTDESRYTNHTQGYWDSIDVINWTYTRNGNNDSRGTDPNTLISDYNTDLANQGTNTAPAMWFNANASRKMYFSDGMVIKKDTGWPNVSYAETQKIYWVSVDASGVSLTPIVDAVITAGAVTQSIPSGLSTKQQKIAQSFLTQSWDSSINWDTYYEPTALKDYFVIDRADKIATAWSRGNFWVHRDTVFKLAEMNPLMDAEAFATLDNQAKRPIIEFDGGMHLLEHGNDYNQEWAGPVDFILDLASLNTQVQDGRTYITEDDNVIYMRDSTQGSDPVFKTLATGDTFFVKFALSTNTANTQILRTKYVRHDLWIDSSGFTKIGLAKKKVNQPPLFVLYDEAGVSLLDTTKYPKSTFAGNKIFAYKEGTGTTIDTELDMVLSLKDIGPKAEYEFVNHANKDTYTFSNLTSENGLVDTDPIKGYFAYKCYGKTKNVYTNSIVQRGSTEEVKHIVTDGTVAQEIKIGYNDWRAERKFFVYRHGASGTFTATESFSSGVINNKRHTRPTIVVRAGGTYTFEDLIGSLQFRDELEAVTTTGVTTSGNTHTVVMPASAGIMHYGYGSNNKGKIIILDTDDYLYHDVYIDGKRVRQSEYTIGATTISIPANLVEQGSIIDVVYQNADATKEVDDYAIPHVHEHNANNKPLHDFTISETFDHWEDLIYKTPELSGQSFGINDSRNRVYTGAGGTIFMYDDISIMHDYTYADTRYDVREALASQAREFWGFRRRFESQVLRLYKSKTYSSVKDIVRDAIRAISETRKGTELHKQSNMVYWSDKDSYILDLATGQTNVIAPMSVNTDFNAMDHMYVYLAENNGSNQYYERLLVKGVDYKTNGSEIILSSVATAVDVNNPAYLTVQIVSREEYSYIPASMVKLGLTFGTPPQIDGNQIVLHDGDRRIWDNTKELYAVNDPAFDVVNACMFDLEKRIWAGLVDLDNTRSANTWLPGPHLDTWYTKEKLDNYTEQLWQDYVAKQDIADLNPTNYYDTGDNTTWNYNSFTYNGKNVPGYWRGAYTYIFGTDNPHLTPWHMLGFNKKPKWWNDYYSWTDATKRAALINALTKGIVTNPGDAIQRTEIKYARYNWDWANNCPVTSTGTLEDIEVVLGTPTAIASAKPFVFGDWSPTEYQWRRSALGQSALVDAILKLNPARAWSEFFQPGEFILTPDAYNQKKVNKTNRVAITPDAILYDGEKNYTNRILRIDVKSSTTGWGADSTLSLYSANDVVAGVVKLDIDSTGTIQGATLVSGGMGYTDTPVFDLQNSGSGSDPDALAEFKFVTSQYEYESNGINRIVKNNLLRKYIDPNTLYSDLEKLDTRLMQKVGGFTSDSLVNLYTDSGANGKYKVNSNDYGIHLYKAPPRKIFNVSKIKITKRTDGWEVNGLSSAKQKFYFYEPERKANNFKQIELPTGVIKKYNSFDYTTVSSMEFGSVFAKVQDLYDFVRGYYEYLNFNNINVETVGDAAATDAAVFAVSAELGDEEELYIGEWLRHDSTQGRLVSFGTLPGGLNSVLDTEGDTIDEKELVVDRYSTETGVQIKSKLAKELGYIGVALVDFEHIIEFKNTTQFNDTLFNDVTNQRHHRLKFKGQRTKNWDGNTRAPGYLIFDNKIVENFDTSVQTIANIYNYNVDNVNPVFHQAENLTIGNYDKKWVKESLLDDSTFGRFYQGMVKGKGTTGSIAPYNRSTLLNDGDSVAKIHEEWMFRHSYYGDNTNVNATEIKLTPDMIDNNVEIINFDGATYVNGSSVSFTTESLENFTKRERILRTAGEVINTVENDDNIVEDLPAMKTVFDPTAGYANIETWSGTKSYKRGDRVRYAGGLMECAVNAIGYNTQASGLTIDGTVLNPVFTYASQAASDPASAVIDGTAIWFDEQDTVFDPIIVTSNANPSVPSGDSIIIDGITLQLNNVVLVPQINTAAAQNGNPHFTCQTSGDPNVIIPDNTGENLIINGATIPLSTGSTGAHPDGSSLTKNQVAAIISGTADSNLSAVVQSGEIIIIYNANGNVNTNLVLGNGSANNELRIVPGTYSPSVINVSQAQNMDASTLASKINSHGSKPVYISAIASGSNQLVITKSPTSTTTTSTTLTLTGTIPTAIGLPQTTGVTSSLVSRPQSVFDARDAINNAGISGVTASASSAGKLVISSTNASIDLGQSSNEMNTKAGLPSGIVYTTTTVVANTFDINDWTLVSPSDEALFKIQVVNDSNADNPGGTVAGPTVTIPGLGSVGTTVPSVFNGWNVFQVMNKGMFSQIEDSNGNTTDQCSLCAGTSTSDGNDAQVNVNIPHGLSVGDYVMIVNSTSIPSCDGIHKVTRLGEANEPKRFYIDTYIDECGSSPQIFVLRNTRFNDYNDIQKVAYNTGANGAYDWQDGDIVYSNTHTYGPSGRGTYVYRWSLGGFSIDTSRTVTTRPINKANDSTQQALDYAVIYDGSRNGRETSLVLETFDPIMNQIPGIASMQIDSTSFVDRAGYTNSTDINEPILLNVQDAWGEAEVGKTWWDTTNAIYYDYNQGSDEYKRNFWGKLTPNGSIDVYEWTKSTVTPDEWDESVQAGLEMFGTICSGTPYAIINSVTNEKIYYYTADQDYDSKTGEYVNVYYFWVKGKNTFAADGRRSTSVEGIASIIKDPTAFGISWCAAIDTTKLIIANVNFATDNNSVLQINKALGKASHNSWTVLQEGSGLIPEYWYRGILDNLVGRQATSGVEFPNKNLHDFNKFGDDRALGQSWFYNFYDARIEAVASINNQLKNINLVQDLRGLWDRTIGTDAVDVIDINVDYSKLDNWAKNTAYSAGDLVKFNNKIYKAINTHTSGTSSYAAFNNNLIWDRYASLYNLEDMWEYADFVSKDRLTNELPTTSVNRPGDLDTIDITKHQVAEVRVRDADGYDRTEIHKWTGTKWIIVEKKNATIQFKSWLGGTTKIDAWDKNPWDHIAWDGNVMVYWHYLVYALRHDIMIGIHEDEFNKFFFSLVRYTLSKQKQVDWVYKTTYIKVEVSTPVNTKKNKYNKGSINTLLGYINDVKPFHTKIRNVVDTNTIDEVANTSITDTYKFDTTIKLNQFEVQEEGNDYGDSVLLPNVYGNDILESVFGTTTFDSDYSSQAFTDTSTPTNVVSGGSFVQPGLHNYTSESTNNRNALAQLDLAENLTITIITNTSGDTVNADTRTFAYRQDGKMNQFVDVLETASSTTTTANIDAVATTIAVTSDAVFNAAGGEAYINGEVIKYGSARNNTLYNVERGYASSKAHASGSTIVSLEDANVFTGTITSGSTNANNEYIGDNKLNDIAYNSGTSEWEATSILSGTGLLSARMSSGTQGIDL